MQSQFTTIYLPLLGLVAGAIIGFGFGAIQAAATRRHAKLEKEGKFKTGWAATPGSFRRIAYLLVSLAVIQYFFPAFFASGGASQYCVAGGVALGYGFSLFKQLRRRLA